jgi:hypothetical protein
MSESILILGESGTGKSTAIRTLDPKCTFIVNVIGKPLPFRGYKAKFKPVSKDGTEGNHFMCDDPHQIIKILKFINEKRPDITNVIIDDFGYVISNSFMRKAMMKGYDKYTDIGKEIFDVLEFTQNLREDLFCIFTMHTEIDKFGRSKPKTVGNMIDQYICIEGKFTYCLHSLANEGNYKFLTNNHGQYMAKSPLGVFDDLVIDNDLQYVLDKINEFNNYVEEEEDIEQG